MDSFIKLKKYFNEKAIGNPQRELGEYILKESFYPSGRIVCRAGIPFLLEYGESFDNISCDGREIEIEAWADKIFVLGFSEYGVFRHPVALITDDGEIPGYIELHDKNWFTKYSWVFDRKKELELRSCKVYDKILWNNGKKYLYYSETEVPRKYVRKIVLPDCEWTHIFAITAHTESDEGRPETGRGERV